MSYKQRETFHIMYGEKINQHIYTFASQKGGLFSLAQGHDKEHPEPCNTATSTEIRMV